MQTCSLTRSSRPTTFSPPPPGLDLYDLILRGNDDGDLYTRHPRDIYDPYPHLYNHPDDFEMMKVKVQEEEPILQVGADGLFASERAVLELVAADAARAAAAPHPLMRRTRPECIEFRTSDLRPLPPPPLPRAYSHESYFLSPEFEESGFDFFEDAAETYSAGGVPYFCDTGCCEFIEDEDELEYHECHELGCDGYEQEYYDDHHPEYYDECQCQHQHADEVEVSPPPVSGAHYFDFEPSSSPCMSPFRAALYDTYEPNPTPARGSSHTPYLQPIPRDGAGGEGFGSADVKVRCHHDRLYDPTLTPVEGEVEYGHEFTSQLPRVPCGNVYTLIHQTLLDNVLRDAGKRFDDDALEAIASYQCNHYHSCE